MRNRVIFALVVAAVSMRAGLVLAQANPPATKPAATAIEAAKHYTSFFVARQPAKAIESYWDLDEIFVSMFGKDLMAKQSAADKAEMHRLLAGLFKGIYANPQIVEAMATAEYTGYAAKDAGDGKTVVSFKVKVKDAVLDNSLTFVKKDGQFRIVDAATGGNSLNTALAGEFQKQPAGTTPLQFVKAITESK